MLILLILQCMCSQHGHFSESKYRCLIVKHIKKQYLRDQRNLSFNVHILSTELSLIYTCPESWQILALGAWLPPEVSDVLLNSWSPFHKWGSKGCVRDCRLRCCLWCDPGQGAESAAESRVTGVADGVRDGISVSSTHPALQINSFLNLLWEQRLSLVEFKNSFPQAVPEHSVDSLTWC